MTHKNRLNKDIKRCKQLLFNFLFSLFGFLREFKPFARELTYEAIFIYKSFIKYESTK